MSADSTLQDIVDAAPRRRVSRQRAESAPAGGEGQMGEYSILRHDDPENKHLGLPRDMSVTQARDFLNAKVQESDQITIFTRQYKFRPDDGANAAANVVGRMYGIAVGVTIKTMFGDIHPETRTIRIGKDQTRLVPWGRTAIAALENTFIALKVGYDDDLGLVFQVDVEGPHKWKAEVDDLFNEIQRELETNSIYKGKVLCGTDVPEFMDVSSFDRTTIQFANDVEDVLETALFGAIRHTEAMRADGVPLKRTFLLTGTYGTGKSSVAQMAAQECEANGWTFVLARTGRDSVVEALRTARMYQPSVCVLEDIDTQASTAKPDEVAELLETFDGITAKDNDVMVIMTSNHKDRIHAGMLRPGRVDYIVEIGELDRDGTERLLRAVIDPSKLAGDVDFDEVHAAMTVQVPCGDDKTAPHHFEPAFVRETAQHAKTWALVRAGGDKYQLTTTDLVRAAKALHPQLVMLKLASEGIPSHTIEGLMEQMVYKALGNVLIEDRDDDDQLPYIIRRKGDDDRD